MKSRAERGLIVRAIGDTVALSPPLVIIRDETADLLSRLEKTLEDTAAWITTQPQAA
jgi:4-aminobutyrate--pyruvate transaminase